MVEQFRIEGESNSAAKEAADRLRTGIYDRPESFGRDRAKAAGADEPKDKAKDKSEDKPKTKEDLEREAVEMGKRLIKESANGEWSEESKKTWSRVFDGIVKQKNITPEETMNYLNQAGAELNKALEKMGSNNRIGMGVAEDAKKGEVRFYMQLNGPGINKADNAQAVAEDKETKTVIRAGTLKIK
ncbi:MAG: hypothetical protein C5B53_11525 [Candidatus Melainabacteria bacterium]|nr:MAG: hypothetical protein C5B53_11525 [Candidatus Melainabacteria bacterium]